MLVRFYHQGSWHKSEVYAVLNTGIFERLLLRVRSESGDYFLLLDSMKKSENSSFYEPLAERILKDFPSRWLLQTSNNGHETLSEYRKLLRDETLFYRYYGFPWLWEEQNTLVRLLNGEKVPVRGSIFEGRLYSDLDQPGWTFVETQEDAERFLQETCGLHDSVIHSILYESGDCVDEEQVMHLPELRRVRVELHSQWCPRVELIFEGVTALNLRPPGENYLGDILDCTLLVQDCAVYWADSGLEKADFSYPGTWITAYSLKWRFLEK